MIRPVSIGLRIVTILGTMLLQLFMAPLIASTKILEIFWQEILAPLSAQFAKFLQQLEEASREQAYDRTA